MLFIRTKHNMARYRVVSLFVRIRVLKPFSLRTL